MIVLCVAFDDDGTTHYKTRTRIYKGEREREEKPPARISLSHIRWLAERKLSTPMAITSTQERDKTGRL